MRVEMSKLSVRISMHEMEYSLKLSPPFCPSSLAFSIVVVGNQIADSARWADVSIAAMSVRRLSGAAPNTTFAITRAVAAQ